MWTRTATACAVLVGFLWLFSPRLAAEDDLPLAFGGAWQTERIELADGRTTRNLLGLIEAESSDWIEFLELRRRPGRPTHLVRHSLARADITEIERLPEDARATLQRRLKSVRNRAAIEAGRMKNVDLQEVERDGLPRWSFRGRWFHLEAALPSWEVRRLVVRLEQVFRAFDQFLPVSTAKPSAEGRISILVFGDRRHYAAYLRREGIPIRNPAFFDPQRGQVVVASDLGRLMHLKQAAEEEHARRLREQFPKDPAVLAQSVAANDARMAEGGYSAAQRNLLRSLAVSRRQVDERAVERQMQRVQRSNDQAVQAEREQLQRRLFHESFHAYAEPRLVSTEDGRMPLWLSEGLAQVFEAPQFDAEDLLRIDAPDPERLLRLAEDLSGPHPVRLADLLVADQRKFLVPHDDAGETSERHYLYAWGMAYYLAFEHPSLTSRRLAEYAAYAEQPAVAAFEGLVQMPLDAFEAKWRTAMREMGSRMPEE